VWGEGVDFEHGHRMGANWFLSEARNHELRVGMRGGTSFRIRRWGKKYLWKLPSKSLVELSCELSFFLIASVEINYGWMSGGSEGESW